MQYFKECLYSADRQSDCKKEIHMSDKLRSLIKEHHAFYEVLPYYISVEEGHGSPSATTRRIQAGIDIDIYGVNLENELPSPGANPDYALGYAELQRIAEQVSHHSSCSLEVIPVASTAVVDCRNHAQVEGMLRIRISHWRGLDQPAGPPEQQALEAFEHHLHGLGVVRR
jgi:hypothetical protein